MTQPGLRESILSAAVPEEAAAEKVSPAQSVSEAKVDRGAIADFAANAWSSFRYSLVQAPVKSLAQIADRTAGTDLEKNADWFKRPVHAEFGSAAWFGQAVGGTIGSALPFIVMHKMIGPGAATRLETSSSYSLLSRAAVKPVLKSVGAGAVYSGLLTPVEEGEGFGSSKFRSIMVGGVTGGTLTSTAIGIKSLGLRSFNKSVNEAVARESGTVATQTTGLSGSLRDRVWRAVDPIIAREPVRNVLKNDLFAGTAAGGLAGAASAQMNSIMSGRGLASLNETAESTATFMLGGAMLGAGNIIHERYFPTTGIKGVRTLEDMTKLADSTVKAGHPGRYQYKSASPKTNEVQLLTHADESGGSRLNRLLYSELEPTSLPPEVKTRISRGVEDLVTSYDAIQNVDSIVTVYGSARPKANHFAYQRSRYLGGRLAEEGYAVMTGGGPGVMEGANRGAYQAKGKSIGVALELPHEDMGNGYQTIVLRHGEFHTRKEILRNHKAAVVEMGGYGTLDEFAELLTHIQTRKADKVPVYLIKSKATKAFDKYVRELEREGTISPGDRELYKIVNGPDDIIADLRARDPLRVNNTGTGIDGGVPLLDTPAGIAVPARQNRWTRFFS